MSRRVLIWTKFSLTLLRMHCLSSIHDMSLTDVAIFDKNVFVWLWIFQRNVNLDMIVNASLAYSTFLFVNWKTTLLSCRIDIKSVQRVMIKIIIAIYRLTLDVRMYYATHVFVIRVRICYSIIKIIDVLYESQLFQSKMNAVQYFFNDRIVFIRTWFLFIENRFHDWIRLHDDLNYFYLHWNSWRSTDECRR